MLPSPLPLPRGLRMTAAALVLASGCAMAETSSALSKATVVDTRDLLPVTEVPTPLLSTGQEHRTLVRRSSARTSIQRTAGKSALFEVKIPKFASKGGGWGRREAGLGVFYGMEVLYSGSPGDRLDHLPGGPPPATSTPARAWRTVSPPQVLNVPLTQGRHYFRVRFDSSPAPDPFFIVRFHSARLCSASGAAIQSISRTKPVWLVFHGTDSGESSLRNLHNALQAANRDAEVISVDWASAAASSPPWTQPTPAGEYLPNLGRNLALLLENLGIPRNQVHLLGHGTGSLAAYETARHLGGTAHLIALDPSPDLAKSYPTRGVSFSKVSRVATSLIGGPSGDESIGDELLASRSDFSIRLLSAQHRGDPPDADFDHWLPVAWCAQVLADDATPYGAFFRSRILFRTKPKPTLPWGAQRKLSGNLDLDCRGTTRYRMSSSPAGAATSFDSVHFLVFRKPGGTLTKARASGGNGSPIRWTYSRP